MEDHTPAARLRPHATPAAALLVAAVLATGCGGAPAAAPPSSGGEGATGTTAATSAPPSATPAASTTEQAGLPDPEEKIPQDPAKLAAALKTTTARLYRAIDDWTGGDGGAKGRPPEPVVLLALYQQRIYRHAAYHPELARKAFARLPDRLAAAAKDDVTAIREIISLARPVKKGVPFKTQEPPPAATLLGHFKKAERRFGVEWEVLAAVMFDETKFARVKSASHAGAQGPMQFLPATWKAYGLGGDIHDPGDAVMGAANYLRASGAPRDYRRALHAYNPSDAYVNAILAHARQIKRDVRNYYAYYNWQVFVLTTTGERRLTGP
ncbi:hypothetical protein Sru01_16590 [Sphaerisporangium rufum]|uniref:Transglycosylase SLT domain-containing protein n=1 Tax=Sphaerisporangium rufum TaxID=1381558 RepID=A0A919UZU1_9ACTN|nr:lytic transglycosylase domain-containing protein [Sphaerisporangium rufum]GII76677.1 hypothetical protein Sru01_16590 [Sphaerisporangium rufum]